ncbi:MAG TPA: hypothetical protein DEA26_10685 [Oceanospirillales bacterium]|nr:hypothetical protein [Oceanospirillaceae bacterium]HBS43138.1 hypothetical protein [Oceanospirillales bacterium]|tara:strand:- start:2875 stop:3120 length:246 start_codon:yes stop_codon:yes gene_type:complete
MNQATLASTDTDKAIKTLLSNRVLIPMTCDHCQQDTDVSMETLQSSSTFMCEHCYQVRSFVPAELEVLQLLLTQTGYRITG